MAEVRPSPAPESPEASAPTATPSAVTKARPSQPPDPLLGRVINDRFKIISMMARGGMGKVYRAEQAPLGREVALKVLNPNYNGEQDPEFHRRFFLEASICSKLTHPNTVTIFDYGRTDDDVYFIAMELLEGRTLHRAIRDEGRFPPARALHVARQIARSLREAHAMGVVHRDLKPANVFLVKHGDETDFVKVLDFGLVKNVADAEDLTQTGLFMGSPKYMAPEQIRGEKTDARSDIYSLGVILYEMLTGKVPFDRTTSVNILMAHVHEPPPPFSVVSPGTEVPPALEALVMKALDKSPDGRFASMDELLVALKEITTPSGQAVLTPHPSMELGVTGRFAASADPMRQSGPGPSGPISVVSASGPVAALGTPNAGTSVPPVAPLSVPPPRPLPVGWIAAGAAAVLSLVGVALWLGRGPEPVVTTTGTDTTEPETTGAGAVAPPETREEPAPLRTTVSVESTPAGASVRVEREGAEPVTLGTTPTSVVWTGADAELGRQVNFVFELDGHRAATVTRTVTGPELDVEVVLEAVRTARPYRPRPPRRPEGGDDTDLVGPVKGYKTDPY